MVGQLLDGERAKAVLEHFRDARVAQRILLHLQRQVELFAQLIPELPVIFGYHLLPARSLLLAEEEEIGRVFVRVHPEQYMLYLLCHRHNTLLAVLGDFRSHGDSLFLKRHIADFQHQYLLWTEQSTVYQFEESEVSRILLHKILLYLPHASHWE